MATPIVKSVGATARDYATSQLFEDAIPADITSTDETWTGECHNDSEFTTKTLFTGVTTDATRWVKLTTASGESFIDHADKLTNALAYDQAKGVGINVNTAYSVVLEVRDDYVTIEKLQIKAESRGGTDYGVSNTSAAANTLFQNLIIHGVDDAVTLYIYASTNKIVNSLVISEATSKSGVIVGNGAKLYNVTVVSPSDVTNTATGLETLYSNNVAKNCCSFGFNTDYSASGWDTGNSSHNASDSTGNPGGNSQDSKTFADQFETVAVSGMDFRVKTGSDLENNGTRDQTNTNDLDIIGQSRSTSTPTIGAWEFIVAVGATSPWYYYAQMTILMAMIAQSGGLDA